MNARFIVAALYAVILAFFSTFFILPVIIAVRGAFVDQTGSPTFAYLAEVFQNPIYVEGFSNTLRIAIASTCAAFLFAAPLAWINHRFNFPGKSAFGALLVLPVMMPPFVGAIGFRQ